MNSILKKFHAKSDQKIKNRKMKRKERNKMNNTKKRETVVRFDEKKNKIHKIDNTKKVAITNNKADKKNKFIAKEKKDHKEEDKKGEKANKPENMDFGEESIKKRITDMLDDFKNKGGRLELASDDEVDDGDFEDNDNEDGDVVASDEDEELEEANEEGSEEDDQESEENNEKKSEEDEDEDEDADEDEDEDEVIDMEDDHKVGKQNGDEANMEGEKTKREKHKFDFEKNTRTVFVGNLPSDIDQKAIMKLFKDCGPVESARIRSIVPEKETLSPKVALITKQFHPKVDSFNAYVVFKTNEEDKCVTKALTMNGKELNGHRIRVDRASRPKARKETLTSRKKSVFVGNLRFDTRDDELLKHFESKVGPVKHVRLVRDSSTGVGKGFGFVVFNERLSVKKALELDETPLRGRNMRIKKIEEDKPDKKKPGKNNEQSKKNSNNIKQIQIKKDPTNAKQMLAKKFEKKPFFGNKGNKPARFERKNVKSENNKPGNVQKRFFKKK